MLFISESQEQESKNSN